MMKFSLLSNWKRWLGRSTVKLNGQVVLLAEIPLDEEVQVIRIEVSQPGRIHRLAALGILPGARLRLLQNRGAYLAKVDRSQIAFDKAVASAVWVQKTRDSH